MVRGFEFGKLKPEGTCGVGSDGRVMFTVSALGASIQSYVDRFGLVLLSNHLILMLDEVIEYNINLHFACCVHDLSLHVVHHRRKFEKNKISDDVGGKFDAYFCHLLEINFEGGEEGVYVGFHG